MEDEAKKMYPAAYDIYKACFPHISMTKEIFLNIIAGEQYHFVHVERDGKLAAFSLVHENAVRLICVHPDYQKTKLGRMILMMSEGSAAGKGYKNVVIGGNDSPFFFIGAEDGSKGFFEKMGGEFSDCPFYEMKIELSDFENKFSPPENVRFEFFDGDLEKLHSAVEAVDDDWVRFFNKDSKVLCGYMGERIVSFCTVDYDDVNLISDGKCRIASIGCVGTLPEYRRRGIGLSMVSAAADLCKDNGCDKAFIHYTYCDKWYEKVGAVSVLKVWQCSITLPDWKVGVEEK